ncbi:MFS general substrate transporter [Gautieria morchelliformis]|nr:MFS general substrate transporter [Gautieria morchelliformis]
MTYPAPDVHPGGSHRMLSRRSRLTLTCISVALNTTTAGGIFTFPLIAESSDISRFRLTQPQLSTIVLAGMIGQYPFAPVVGSAVDRVGPWACSLAAAILFSTGFGLFSLEFRTFSESISQPSSGSFLRLVFFYFLAGLGTVTSYFSALFSASKNFPEYSGLAAGVTMALFGLSPLILSFFASTWFTDAQGDLNVSDFTAFLAILTGVVHIIGAITMTVEVQPKQDVLYTSPTFGGLPEDQAGEANSEATPLLPKKSGLQTYDRVWDVLRDYHFWVLALVVLLALGSCEMVIANIGTISLALPGLPAPSALAYKARVSTAATQVRLLSLSNTISRITIGPMADFVSPVASYLPSGLLALPRQHRVSRVAFLLGACVLMTLAFIWMTFGVTSQQGIWAFSIGIGIAYGSIFTVLPSLIASIWGNTTLARNFGLITYFPFVGTSAFSYLYAFVASAATETKDGDGYSEGACVGKHCWSVTFCICAGCGLVAASCSAFLWKRWRGQV